jgi:hypothetical protein
MIARFYAILHTCISKTVHVVTINVKKGIVAVLMAD